MNEISDNGGTGESKFTILEADNISYVYMSAHPTSSTDTVDKLVLTKIN